MWNPFLVWLCIAGTIIVGSQGEEPSQEKVVQTSQGPIRGYKSPDYNVFQFWNIPYATAPTGVDKFKAPLEPPTWEETFNATNRGIICPQMNINPSHVVQEDCLVASVYAPDTQTPNASLPVLVVVHGGGYQAGYGDEMTPVALVNSQKIVAVTFNYRLGIHGFLCLGTEVAPGNAGMKDQVALLQWVKRNIAAFGGDPGKVTIAGCSAGGSSVDTLMLSDTTSGLFHQIISESGCSLAPFGIQMDPLKNAIDHAALLNFTYTDDITALGEFYSSLSVELLTESILPNMMAGNAGYFVFQPCVERDIGQERFLADAPIDILRNGNHTKVPTLYGYADMEGILNLIFFNLWLNDLQNSFENFLPVDLKFENDTQRTSAANAAKQLYFGGEVTNTSLIEFIDYTSDVMFIHPILRAVSLQIAAGNEQVYLYQYGFVHTNSITLPGDDRRGASHCEQMATAFKHVGSHEASEEFLEMADKMEELYLNFILTGNPNLGANSTWPVWKPVNDTDRTPYFLIRETAEVINTENNQEIDGNLTSRVEFWDQIYLDNDIRRPIPPPEVILNGLLIWHSEHFTCKITEPINSQGKVVYTNNLNPSRDVNTSSQSSAESANLDSTPATVGTACDASPRPASHSANNNGMTSPAAHTSSSRAYASVAASRTPVQNQRQAKKPLGRSQNQPKTERSSTAPAASRKGEPDMDGFVTVERKKRKPTSRNQCGTALIEPNMLLCPAIPTTQLYVSLHYKG